MQTGGRRLKAIAAQAADAMLTEGPVHPDHALLDVCAESLHHRRLSAEFRKTRDALPMPYGNLPATQELVRLAATRHDTATRQRGDHANCGLFYRPVEGVPGIEP
jgi:hypothetical protein